MKFKKTLFVLLVAGFVLSACSKNENTNEMSGGRGPKVSETEPPNHNGDNGAIGLASPQAVGFYAEGKLINDFTFPLEATAVLKVFRSRNRNFSTDDLYQVISHAANLVWNEYPGSERLQIGDIAKRGGGQLALHASHQNGLDADIAYYRVNRRELNPEGFGGFDEIFVKSGKVTANLDLERNYELMRHLVSTGVVNRMFMDAVIKTKFCELAKGQKLTDLDKETLRRMRPLENHRDHFHLRIQCPRTSPDCVTQVEPPAGTGCPAAGKTLINMFDPFDME